MADLTIYEKTLKNNNLEMYKRFNSTTFDKFVAIYSVYRFSVLTWNKTHNPRDLIEFSQQDLKTKTPGWTFETSLGIKVPLISLLHCSTAVK